MVIVNCHDWKKTSIPHCHGEITHNSAYIYQTMDKLHVGCSVEEGHWGLLQLNIIPQNIQLLHDLPVFILYTTFIVKHWQEQVKENSQLHSCSLLSHVSLISEVWKSHMENLIMKLDFMVWSGIWLNIEHFFYMSPSSPCVLSPD